MGNSVVAGCYSAINAMGELNSKMCCRISSKGLEHWMRDAEDRLPS